MRFDRAPKAALPLLERATRIAERDRPQPDRLSDIYFLHGQALFNATGDRKKARARASKAAAILASLALATDDGGAVAQQLAMRDHTQVFWKRVVQRDAEIGIRPPERAIRAQEQPGWGEQTASVSTSWCIAACSSRPLVRTLSNEAPLRMPSLPRTVADMGRCVRMDGLR